MPWFKVDDAFHGHPKVLELSLPAVGLWTLAGSWCASYLTDGEITLRAIGRLGGNAKTAKELVDAGLWLPAGEDTYQFKDWIDYQPLKAEIEAERDAARERMKNIRARKKGSPERAENVRPNTPEPFAGTSEEVRVTPTQPIPTRPDKEEAKASSSERIRPNEFLDWYTTYPRHESKGLAEKAYIKARKKASAGELMAGAERYANDPNREPQFTKLPASWLNAGCWEDGPLPPRSQPQPRPTGSQTRLQAGFELLQQTRAEHGQLELGA